ncbi:MAG: 3-hydroxyacyl-ACP dehydratase FabZ [candidate division WS1 bacterium]|nr:3-hydroxyacyl-ACP dehydratase FabZ [candidate division WS1 bacterium]
MMDIKAIQAILPHRYPFLLVDRVLEVVPGERAVAIKNVSFNEPQFTGHWPGDPVMPGVLILEAMAQTGGVMLLSHSDDIGSNALFAGLDNVRFRRQVIPGDQLRFEATLLRRKGNIGKAHVVATVDGEIAVEGDFMFAVANRE